MSFDPALTLFRDHIRFHIGDTDEATHWIEDATIDTLLAQFGYLEALAQIADARAAQLYGATGTAGAKRFKEGDEEVEKFDSPGFFSKLAERARTGQILAPNMATNVHQPYVVEKLVNPNLTDLVTD